MMNLYCYIKGMMNSAFNACDGESRMVGLNGHKAEMFRKLDDKEGVSVISTGNNEDRFIRFNKGGNKYYFYYKRGEKTSSLDPSVDNLKFNLKNFKNFREKFKILVDTLIADANDNKKHVPAILIAYRRLISKYEKEVLNNDIIALSKEGEISTKTVEDRYVKIGNLKYYFFYPNGEKSKNSKPNVSNLKNLLRSDTEFRRKFKSLLEKEIKDGVGEPMVQEKYKQFITAADAAEERDDEDMDDVGIDNGGTDSMEKNISFSTINSLRDNYKNEFDTDDNVTVEKIGKDVETYSGLIETKIGLNINFKIDSKFLKQFGDVKDLIPYVKLVPHKNGYYVESRGLFSTEKQFVENVSKENVKGVMDGVIREIKEDVDMYLSSFDDGVLGGDVNLYDHGLFSARDTVKIKNDAISDLSGNWSNEFYDEFYNFKNKDIYLDVFINSFNMPSDNVPAIFRKMLEQGLDDRLDFNDFVSTLDNFGVDTAGVSSYKRLYRNGFPIETSKGFVTTDAEAKKYNGPNMRWEHESPVAAFDAMRIDAKKTGNTKQIAKLLKLYLSYRRVATALATDKYIKPEVDKSLDYRKDSEVFNIFSSKFTALYKSLGGEDVKARNRDTIDGGYEYIEGFGTVSPDGLAFKILSRSTRKVDGSDVNIFSLNEKGEKIINKKGLLKYLKSLILKGMRVESRKKLLKTIKRLDGISNPEIKKRAEKEVAEMKKILSDINNGALAKMNLNSLDDFKNLKNKDVKFLVAGLNSQMREEAAQLKINANSLSKDPEFLKNSANLVNKLVDDIYEKLNGKVKKERIKDAIYRAGKEIKYSAGVGAKTTIPGGDTILGVGGSMSVKLTDNLVLSLGVAGSTSEGKYLSAGAQIKYNIVKLDTGGHLDAAASVNTLTGVHGDVKWTGKDILLGADYAVGLILTPSDAYIGGFVGKYGRVNDAIENYKKTSEKVFKFKAIENIKDLQEKIDAIKENDIFKDIIDAAGSDLSDASVLALYDFYKSEVDKGAIKAGADIWIDSWTVGLATSLTTAKISPMAGIKLSLGKKVYVLPVKNYVDENAKDVSHSEIIKMLNNEKNSFGTFEVKMETGKLYRDKYGNLMVPDGETKINFSNNNEGDDVLTSVNDSLKAIDITAKKTSGLLELNIGNTFKKDVEIRVDKRYPDIKLILGEKGEILLGGNVAGLVITRQSFVYPYQKTFGGSLGTDVIILSKDPSAGIDDVAPENKKYLSKLWYKNKSTKWKISDGVNRSGENDEVQIASDMELSGYKIDFNGLSNLDSKTRAKLEYSMKAVNDLNEWENAGGLDFKETFSRLENRISFDRSIAPTSDKNSNAIGIPWVNKIVGLRRTEHSKSSDILAHPKMIINKVNAKLEKLGQPILNAKEAAVLLSLLSHAYFADLTTEGTTLEKINKAFDVNLRSVVDKVFMKELKGRYPARRLNVVRKKLKDIARKYYKKHINEYRQEKNGVVTFNATPLSEENGWDLYSGTTFKNAASFVSGTALFDPDTLSELHTYKSKSTQKLIGKMGLIGKAFSTNDKKLNKILLELVNPLPSLENLNTFDSAFSRKLLYTPGLAYVMGENNFKILSDFIKAGSKKPKSLRYIFLKGDDGKDILKKFIKIATELRENGMYREGKMTIKYNKDVKLGLYGKCGNLSVLVKENFVSTLKVDDDGGIKTAGSTQDVVYGSNYKLGGGIDVAAGIVLDFGSKPEPVTPKDDPKKKPGHQTGI